MSKLTTADIGKVWRKKGCDAHRPLKVTITAVWDDEIQYIENWTGHERYLSPGEFEGVYEPIVEPKMEMPRTTVTYRPRAEAVAVPKSSAMDQILRARFHSENLSGHENQRLLVLTEADRAYVVGVWDAAKMCSQAGLLEAAEKLLDLLDSHSAIEVWLEVDR